MKILKSWLQDYIDKDISDNRLEEIFLLSGLELEEKKTNIDDQIIVAEIQKIKKHPNADKLRLVTVTTGKDTITIVCGASNIAVGQIVPLALPGAIINGQELKVSNIRGQESAGMLCAPDELGIGDDHNGIYILPNDCQIGQKVNQYFAIDSSYDLEVTANRGDCLSHIGIAREIAAYENTSAKKQPITLGKADQAHASTEIQVEVASADKCLQYQARVIKGVSVGPSPKWLADRLTACGAKPINNIVDATNYILLDLGQPMHAFDQAKISKKKIVVRNAKKNELIITLDGEERQLDNDALVIADSEKVIALAGIMGAKNSEVDNQTVDVVLEAAEFEPKNIRRTAKKLGILTEASYRFERGVDSGGIDYAINKAANLIVEIAGGRIMSGVVSFGQKPEKSVIDFSHDKIRQLLGIEIADEAIDHILRLLGFAISGSKCEVPLWRHDIGIWQDLAEEIGRLIGYDKVKLMPLAKNQNLKKSSYYYVEQIKDILSDAGFSETMNYPFLSKADSDFAKLDKKNLLEISNPLQSENKYLRNSLIVGLLKNLAKNPSFDPINLFEVGHVFSKSRESQNLGLVSTEGTFEQFKARVVQLSKLMGIDNKLFILKSFARNDLVSYKIKRSSVYSAELSLTKIFTDKKIDQNLTLKQGKDNIVYRGVSKYPAVTRDLAFIVDKQTKAEEVGQEIQSLSELISRVELFDEFVSNKFGQNKKNIAYHISLQSKEKTLVDADAEVVIDKIIQSIEKKYSAKQRKT